MIDIIRYAATIRIAVFVFLAAGLSTTVLSQVRVEDAPQKIMPKGSFDEAAAKTQLAAGTAGINGKACGIFGGSRWSSGGWRRSSSGGTRVPASGIIISLYPDTPYLREWLKLGEKHGFGAVTMVKPAWDARIDAQTDAEGRFKFTKLKKGKYYLYGYGEFTEDGKSFGTSLEAFVEVDDNDVLDLNLSNFGKLKDGFGISHGRPKC